MEQYNKYSYEEGMKPNFFQPLFGCLSDLCSCSMGLCFPYCLFGRIYEKAGFGSCIVGCSKYFALQMGISSIFTFIIYLIEYNMILKNMSLISEDISGCNTNDTCKIDYHNFNKTQCPVDNTTICDCLIKPLNNQCEFDQNLPDTLENMYIYISFVSIMNTLIMCNALGLFLGYYRTKISHKYNILYNSRYNFLIHCLPCSNQCALCQEYNTINLIDSVINVQPPAYVKF